MLIDFYLKSAIRTKTEMNIKIDNQSAHYCNIVNRGEEPYNNIMPIIILVTNDIRTRYVMISCSVFRTGQFSLYFLFSLAS